MGQGFILVYRLKFNWMDEIVLKHGNFCKTEGFHQPIDHRPSLGMLPLPKIARLRCRTAGANQPAQFHGNRYYFPAKRASAGPKHAEVVASAGGPIALFADRLSAALILSASAASVASAMPIGAAMPHC